VQRILGVTMISPRASGAWQSAQCRSRKSNFRAKQFEIRRAERRLHVVVTM
jgi:hypothetical protein